MKDIALQVLLTFRHHQNVTSRFASSRWKVDVPGCEPRARCVTSDCEKLALSNSNHACFQTTLKQVHCISSSSGCGNKPQLLLAVHDCLGIDPSAVVCHDF